MQNHERKYRSAYNYEPTDYFSWSTSSPGAAVNLCPKQIFASSSVLLRTFNCSSAVVSRIQLAPPFRNNDISVPSPRLAPPIRGDPVTGVMSPISKMAVRQGDMFSCLNHFVTVWNYDSKTESPESGSHQFIRDKC